jgi:hypothetical protein
MFYESAAAEAHACMWARTCAQVPEDGEELDEEVREEDAADVAARKRAAAKAREEAELRKRSQACRPACLAAFASMPRLQLLSARSRAALHALRHCLHALPAAFARTLCLVRPSPALPAEAPSYDCNHPDGNHQWLNSLTPGCHRHQGCLSHWWQLRRGHAMRGSAC